MCACVLERQPANSGIAAVPETPDLYKAPQPAGAFAATAATADHLRVNTGEH